MKKKGTIPVYDICNISTDAGNTNLLIERFGTYLEKHYTDLHRAHRHSFYHLVLFTKGKGTHTIDFQQFEVKPFQVYFMIPGQVHSWHFQGAMDGYLIHFNESFISSFVQPGHYLERFSFFNGVAADGVRQLPVKEQAGTVRLMEALLKERETADVQSPDMIKLLLLQLFIHIERATNAGGLEHIPPQKTLLLQNFQQLIAQHYRDFRLPKEYAALLYVTPNHLNALCRELLGKTAGQLIRERLILEAKRLLTNAEMNITGIAYELKFEDNSYFNRVFKKETGLTPDAFRKQFLQPGNNKNA